MPKRVQRHVVLGRRTTVRLSTSASAAPMRWCRIPWWETRLGGEVWLSSDYMQGWGYVQQKSYEILWNSLLVWTGTGGVIQRDPHMMFSCLVITIGPTPQSQFGSGFLWEIPTPKMADSRINHETWWVLFPVCNPFLLDSLDTLQYYIRVLIWDTLWLSNVAMQKITILNR